MKSLLISLACISLTASVPAEEGLPSNWVPYTMPVEAQKALIAQTNKLHEVTANFKKAKLLDVAKFLSESQSYAEEHSARLFVIADNFKVAPIVWENTPYYEAVNELAEQNALAWSISHEGTLSIVLAPISHFSSWRKEGRSFVIHKLFVPDRPEGYVAPKIPKRSKQAIKTKRTKKEKERRDAINAKSLETAPKLSLSGVAIIAPKPPVAPVALKTAAPDASMTQKATTPETDQTGESNSDDEKPPPKKRSKRKHKTGKR